MPTSNIYTDPYELLDAFLIKDKKVVWTNGCFDLLHQGHLHSLKEASDHGDFLIVGLNSDSSVKALKGENRPIFNQDYRASLLASLYMVDAVLIFNDQQPLHALEEIKPDIYAKGGDYNVAQLDEAQLVQSYGGKIVTLSLIESPSTSDIIERIKRL